MRSFFPSATRRKRQTAHVSSFSITSSLLQCVHKSHNRFLRPLLGQHQLHLFAVHYQNRPGRSCRIMMHLDNDEQTNVISVRSLRDRRHSKTQCSTLGRNSVFRCYRESGRPYDAVLDVLRRCRTRLQSLLRVRNSSISTSEGRRSRCFVALF